jgi:AcrR family transcriptional regulator
LIDSVLYKIAHILEIHSMKSRRTKKDSPPRRRPRQRRAQQTVEAILDAVVRILKREGYAAITTNHIAEVAGVSIGSLYQYFPNKSAIFIALHGRHIDEIDHVMQNTLVEHASSSLEDLISAIVDAMIDVHVSDPELYELLAIEVPHRADGARPFAVRLHNAFKLAIAARTRELGMQALKKGRNLDKLAFVVTHMVESLSHGALFRRPTGLTLAEAKAEIVRAILVYLRE